MFSDKGKGQEKLQNTLDIQGEEVVAGLEDRKRFFILIIVLGCFSLMALYGAIYLNASIQNLFQNAINEGFSWESTRQKLTRLSVISGRINAPINDVFVSHRINEEREEMRSEYLAFLEVLDQLNEQLEGRQEVTSAQILMFLDDVNASLYAMMSEAEFVFTYLQASQFDLAVERMAIADELYREANGFIGDADQVVQRIALERFNSEATDIRKLYNLGKFVITILTLCFIVFVALGIRMVATLNRNQKTLSYSRSLLSKTLNSVADAVVGCRPDGRIMEWNAQADHLFGDQLAGRVNINSLVPGLLEYIQQKEGTVFDKLRLNHLKAKSEQMHHEGGLGAAGDMDVDINIARIDRLSQKDSQVTAYVLTIRDMREFRKSAALVAKSQAKLRLQLHQNDQIRQQLAAQTVILEQEKVKAEASTEAKSRFLAIMSHELRTPMNAILGFSKILQRGDLNHAQMEVLKRIIDASNHLLGIINDILDMSKIESGGLALEPRPVEFIEEMKHIVQSLGDVKKKPNLRFFAHIDPSLPEKVVIDTTRLRQIITNLLGNAFQFTDEGSICLKVFPVEHEAYESVLQKPGDTIQLIRFEVQDTGIGMTPEQVVKVFEPFTQADNSITRKYGGTGLGLTITRQLIQSFGGQVELESVHGEGSTFGFTVPIELDGNTIHARQDVSRPIAIIANDSRYLEWVEYCLQHANAQYEVFDSVSESFLHWWQQHNQNLLHEHEGPLVFIDGFLSDHDQNGLIPLFDKNRVLLTSCIYLVGVGKESKVHDEQVYGRTLYMPIFPVDLMSYLYQGYPDAQDPNASPYKEILPDLQVPNLIGRQILIVDDVLSNRQYMHELLKATGCGITLVDSGKAAIDVCQIRLFDLIFMDIHMPDMNGYDTTKAIKNIRYARKTHVVGLTSDAIDSVLVTCLEYGMTTCLSKPINAEDFYSTVTFMLHKQNNEQRIVAQNGLENIFFDNVNIDIQGALDRINNKSDLYLKLINAFLKRVENLDSQLKVLLDKSVSSESSQFLESIRGTALSVGATELSDALSGYETALQQGFEATLAYDICMDALHRTCKAMKVIERKIPQL